jgi:NFU1 iron-sulfur cluster scaffold homolog, mitochondrial
MKSTLPINIYTEASPNPNSLKFVVNDLLVPEGITFDFPDLLSAEQSPLALAIYKNFEFVQRIFVMNNFITITKDEETDWYEVATPLKAFIQEYLQSDQPVFSSQLIDDYHTALSDNDSQDNEVIKKIKNLLDEYIRPAVEMDGGAINFHSYLPEEGLLKVLLQGSCSGCPSSTVTLKAGIENLFKRMMPDEIREVVAEGV